MATNQPSETRLRFQRREWKYLVERGRIDALVPDIAMHMRPDAHSSTGPYDVLSLYFDNPEWSAFTEKLDGVQFRKKFRIRSYSKSPKPEDTVLIEVKEKANDVIIKRRTPLEVGKLKELASGRNVKPGDDVIEEWRYHILRHGLRPRMLISYNRLAFEPKGRGEHRVTLDKNVMFSAITSPVEFSSPLKHAGLSRRYAILEIKFGAQLPRFLEELVRSRNLSNEAISKYCDSVITHYKLT